MYSFAKGWRERERGLVGHIELKALRAEKTIGHWPLAKLKVPGRGNFAVVSAHELSFLPVSPRISSRARKMEKSGGRSNGEGGRASEWLNERKKRERRKEPKRFNLEARAVSFDRTIAALFSVKDRCN